MKTKLIILALAALLSGCAPPSSSSSGTNETTPLVDDTEPPVIILPPSEPDATSDTPQPEPFIIKFAVVISDKLYFSNHSEMYLAETGVINQAGQRSFSVNSDLIQYDSTGDAVATTSLTITPTAIKSTADGVYYCDVIPPDIALDRGGRYTEYSEIYKDGAIISAWYNNEYDCKRILSVNSEVFAINQNNGFERLNGAYTDLHHIQDDSFIMHSWDLLNQRFTFNNSIETYGTNHISNAYNWQLFGGMYYSENGYTWNASDGLAEAATTLWSWTEKPYPVAPELPNGENPVMLTAGISEGLLYWIECNSGWVFEYDPDLDSLTQVWRIYLGDGLRTTGILKRDTLAPLMVDNKLYFNNDGVLYSLGIESGFINVFYAGSAEALRW